MKKFVFAVLVVVFMSLSVNLSWSATQYQKLENTAEKKVLPDLNSNDDNIAVEISDLNADSKDDIIIGKFSIVQNTSDPTNPVNSKYLEIWTWDDAQGVFVDETSTWTRNLTGLGHKVSIMDVAIGNVNGIKVIAVCTSYNGVFVYRVNETDKSLVDLNFTTVYQPPSETMGMTLEILEGKMIVGVFGFSCTVTKYEYSDSVWTGYPVFSSNPWGINTFAPSDIKGAKDITTNKTILGVAALDVSWGWGMKNAVYTLNDGNEYRVYTPTELSDCYSVAISFTGGEKIHWGTVSSNEYDVYYRDIEDSLYLFYGYYGYANKIENVTNSTEPVNSLLDKPDTATGMNTDRIRATDQLIAWTYHPNSSGVGIVVYRAGAIPAPYFADVYGVKREISPVFLPVPAVKIQSPTNDTILRVDPDTPALLTIKGEVTDCVQYVSNISVELIRNPCAPPLATYSPNIINMPQETNSTVFRSTFETKILFNSDLVSSGQQYIRIRAINALSEPSTAEIAVVSVTTLQEKAIELYDKICPETYGVPEIPTIPETSLKPNGTQSKKISSSNNNQNDDLAKTISLYNKTLRHQTLSFEIRNKEGNVEPLYENKNIIKWVFNKVEEIPDYVGTTPETLSVFLQKDNQMYYDGIITNEIVLHLKNPGTNTPIEYESEVFVSVPLAHGVYTHVVNDEGQLIGDYSAINKIPFVNSAKGGIYLFTSNSMQSNSAGISRQLGIETRRSKQEQKPKDKLKVPAIDFRGGLGTQNDTLRRANVSLFNNHFDSNGVLATDFALSDPTSFLVFFTAPLSENYPDKCLATIFTIDGEGKEIDKIANYTMKQQKVGSNIYVSEQRFDLVSTDLDDQFQTKSPAGQLVNDGDPGDSTLNIFRWSDITANPTKVIMGGKVQVVIKWQEQTITGQMGIGDEKPLMLDVQGNLFKDYGIDANLMLQNYALANTVFAPANIQLRIPAQINQLDSVQHKINLTNGFDVGINMKGIWQITSDEIALLNIPERNQFQIHFYAANNLLHGNNKLAGISYFAEMRFKNNENIADNRPALVLPIEVLGLQASRGRRVLAHEISHILLHSGKHDTSFFVDSPADAKVQFSIVFKAGDQTFESTPVLFPIDRITDVILTSHGSSGLVIEGTIEPTLAPVTKLTEYVLFCKTMKSNGTSLDWKPYRTGFFKLVTTGNASTALRNLNTKKLMEIIEDRAWDANNNPIRIMGINELLRKGATGFIPR